jgi:hypothetical protein
LTEQGYSHAIFDKKSDEDAMLKAPSVQTLAGNTGQYISQSAGQPLDKIRYSGRKALHFEKNEKVKQYGSSPGAFSSGRPIRRRQAHNPEIRLEKKQRGGGQATRPKMKMYRQHYLGCQLSANNVGVS